jgi:hypothetical protein
MARNSQDRILETASHQSRQTITLDRDVRNDHGDRLCRGCLRPSTHRLHGRCGTYRGLFDREKPHGTGTSHDQWDPLIIVTKLDRRAGSLPRITIAFTERPADHLPACRASKRHGTSSPPRYRASGSCRQQAIKVSSGRSSHELTNYSGHERSVHDRLNVPPPGALEMGSASQCLVLHRTSAAARHRGTSLMPTS